MDLFKGIHPIIFVVIFVCSGSLSGQLYLQPDDKQHGYFTGDSFFVTCIIPEETGKSTDLQWTDSDANAIDSSDGRVHVQPASGDQQGLTLIFLSVEREDSGTYTCSDDTNSVSFDLTVTRSISFGDTPLQQHGVEKEEGIIICNIRPENIPVQWYNPQNQKIEEKSDKYHIQDNHSLKITDLSRRDAGNYTCQPVLITSFGTQIKKIPINFVVQYRPEIIGEPRINHYAQIGTVVQLVCNITSNPLPMFQWLRHDMIIYDNNDYKIFSTDNSSVLQLELKSEEDLGVYICRANNALGEDELTVELKEGNPPQPPKLTVKDHKEDGVKLRIEPSKDIDQDEALKTLGYKVEFTFAADETFEKANSLEFKLDEPHEIRNLSVNSEYLFRAAAHNQAGYSEFSEHVRHKTKSQPEKEAPLVASASGIVASTLVLFTSIVFFRLF